MGPTEMVVRPIGFVRSPLVDKASAPRQASIGSGASATVEILPEHEDGISDLEGFERIWVLFWFHAGEHDAHKRSAGKVQPPRSEKRRGVFATRSPHRPNPIGMSAVRLLRVEGRVLHLADVDLIDGTPVLDVKPYIAYADAFPDAAQGWLEEASDPIARWEVVFAPEAEAQLAWIGDDLRDRAAAALALGPKPHAYRRIKKIDGTDEAVLAVKEWRIRFRAEDARITVLGVASGYRPRDLELGESDAHARHRAFVAQFG